MLVSDETLARQLQQGDPAALDALVERYHASLHGYLVRLTGGDRALAQEMAQEAFLRALRGIRGYHPGRPFKPWLYAIATHIARDYAARADTRRVVPLSDDADLPAHDAEPDAALLADEQAAVVHAALADLPAHQREVVLLYFYEAMPQRAIAAALGIPIGTVKSRLSLGVARLRERMRTYDTERG
jgi:RNA polymerase sigma-70 factor (ECF subfamily)